MIILNHTWEILNTSNLMRVSASAVVLPQSLFPGVGPFRSSRLISGNPTGIFHPKCEFKHIQTSSVRLSLQCFACFMHVSCMLHETYWFTSCLTYWLTCYIYQPFAPVQPWPHHGRTRSHLLIKSFSSSCSFRSSAFASNSCWSFSWRPSQHRENDHGMT
jgi:hypothetical protein